MTYTLKDNDGKIHLLNTTEDFCFGYMREYAKARDLGFYFRTMAKQDGTEVIDYGSHTHFFIVKENNMETTEIYNTLLDLNLFTEDELQLITNMNGYNNDTLNDAIYARFGYRSLEQMLEEDGPSWNAT